MLRLTTATLVRIGAIVVAIATVFAAIAGWIGLDIVAASLEVAPEVQEAGEPAEGMVAAIDGTLEQVRSGLDTLQSITQRVADSSGDAAAVLDEVAALSTGQIPDTLSSLEQALPALIDTAAVIDSTMRTLSVLGVDYQPQVPLDEAFTDVQQQLDGLPESISAQGEDLQALAEEMRTTGEQTDVLSGHIEEIERSLARTQTSLDEYAAAVDSLGRLAEVSDRINTLLPVGRISLGVLAVTGLMLGAIGWSLGTRLQG